MAVEMVVETSAVGMMVAVEISEQFTMTKANQSCKFYMVDRKRICT